MLYKYEKEFREAKPETVSETDMSFDMSNYIEWLEYEFEGLKKVKNNVALADVSNRFVVVKTETGYAYIETPWTNEEIEKSGLFEVVEFFNNKESAIEECNQLNGTQT